MTGRAMAAVAASVFLVCLSVLGRGCDDISTRRPDSPVCNVVEWECEP
jgi:hypothetical protein